MNASDGARQSTPGYRGVVLAMLLLVYTFNFLDRQILGILAVPIKADSARSAGLPSHSSTRSSASPSPISPTAPAAAR
jgi:hypothetical protein